MNQSIIPYRQQGSIEIAEKDRPKYGLIIKPYANLPQHICKLPTPPIRLIGYILRLFGINALKTYDLWRCECGKVFKLLDTIKARQGRDFYKCNLVHCAHLLCVCYCDWCETSVAEWLEAGGIE